MPLVCSWRHSLETVAFAGLLTFLGIGNAAIIPTLDSGSPVAVGPNFGYNYTATLQQDERLDPLNTDGVTCPGVSGLVQCTPPGTFFTLYDVGSMSTFVTASAPAGWGWTDQATGVTPATINAIFDTSLLNVTFFYTGPVVHAAGSLVPFTGFQVVSTIDGVNVNGWFSGQATKDAGVDANTADQFDGHVPVPNSTSGPLGGVPEPSTFVLLGTGLLLVAFARRRSIQS